MFMLLSLQSYNKKNEKPKKKVMKQKKDTLSDVLFLFKIEPSILPKTLFEVEHFVLDAL